jgi:hypothetical protein
MRINGQIDTKYSILTHNLQQKRAGPPAQGEGADPPFGFWITENIGVVLLIRPGTAP